MREEFEGIPAIFISTEPIGGSVFVCLNDENFSTTSRSVAIGNDCSFNRMAPDCEHPDGYTKSCKTQTA